MEINWKERIAKYGYGIDLETATDDDLTVYVETKMHLYARHNLTDYSLWTVFQEDFEDFTPKLFKRVQSSTRMGIRSYLVKWVVYVATHSRRVTISERLFEVIQREEQHQWTDEDIKTTIKELAEPLITVTLRDRLNYTCDGLLGQPTAIVAIPPRPARPTATA